MLVIVKVIPLRKEEYYGRYLVISLLMIAAIMLILLFCEREHLDLACP